MHSPGFAAIIVWMGRQRRLATRHIDFSGATVVELHVGDCFEMKKPHPCGARRFELLRTGADLRLRCLGCGREIWMTRAAFEKAVQAGKLCAPGQSQQQEPKE